MKFGKIAPKAMAISIIAIVIAVGFVESQFQQAQTTELIQFYPMPSVFLNKADGLSLNIHGKLDETVSIKNYRINSGQERMPRADSPRIKDREFVLEFLVDDLQAGKNKLKVTISNMLGRKREVDLSFEYDATTPHLPLVISWQNASLESQDGQWEKIQRGDQVLVRPIPGTEGYDRILLASGAFKGSRRVECTLTFVSRDSSAKLFGFGIMPLWGGHTDSTQLSPHRGWKYGLGWYYSKDEGVGLEFADKIDDDQHITLSKYTKFNPAPGERYKIIIDAQQVLNEHGDHVTYRQTMTWDTLNSNQEPITIELKDDRAEPLKDSHYAVALLAHRAQVEFGPVKVSRIAPIILANQSAE